jgi:hypothetical protein
MAKNIKTITYNLRPSKIYPNWDFWLENEPSGNPALDHAPRAITFNVLFFVKTKFAQRTRVYIKFGQTFHKLIPMYVHITNAIILSKLKHRHGYHFLKTSVLYVSVNGNLNTKIINIIPEEMMKLNWRLFYLKCPNSGLLPKNYFKCFQLLHSEQVRVD